MLSFLLYLEGKKYILMPIQKKPPPPWEICSLYNRVKGVTRKSNECKSLEDRLNISHKWHNLRNHHICQRLRNMSELFIRGIFIKFCENPRRSDHGRIVIFQPIIAMTKERKFGWILFPRSHEYRHETILHVCVFFMHLQTCIDVHTCAHSHKQIWNRAEEILKFD